MTLEGSLDQVIQFFGIGAQLLRSGMIVATALAGVYIILEIFTRGGD